MLFKNIQYVNENFETVSGNIVVSGNKIQSVCETVPADYKGEVYDGANKVALPGMFNVHCHVPMVLLRGYGEGLPLHRWLEERIFPFEDKMGREAMYWGAMLGIAEMIKSGYCSFTDMYMIIDGITQAVEESGFKANLCHGCTAFSDDVGYEDTLGYKGTTALMEYLKTTGHDRIICDAGLHAEYTSTKRVITELRDFALANKLRVHVHVSETYKEHEECKQRRGGRTPSAYFSDLGLFDAPTTAAHCVAVEKADMEIFARKGVTPAHCPTSNLKLGSGIAPIWEMHSMGVNIGIGTDGAASNNNLNGLEEAALASILQRGALRDPMAMDMGVTMRMAALNGAKSQGRSDCGCIKPGNRADIVVYDLTAPHMIPVVDPLSNVLYSAQASDICMNMVDGKVLYKDGELTSIDIDRVKSECCRIQKSILAQL